MGFFDLIEDVADIVTAPVKIAVDVTRVVTKPVADVANVVVEEVKEMTEEITK